MKHYEDPSLLQRVILVEERRRQRRVEKLGDRLGVCPVLHQQPHGLQVTHVRRPVEGREALFMLRHLVSIEHCVKQIN